MRSIPRNPQRDTKSSTRLNTGVPVTSQRVSETSLTTDLNLFERLFRISCASSSMIRPHLTLCTKGSFSVRRLYGHTVTSHDLRSSTHFVLLRPSYTNTLSSGENLLISLFHCVTIDFGTMTSVFFIGLRVITVMS